MSYESDAASAICNALGRCFAAYGDRRVVRTDLTAPMDGVVVVDFSITARGIEVYGSVSVVLDVAEWFGVCFVSNFSTSSARWLRRGPVRISASGFAKELVAACADVPEITLVCPAKSSVKTGFRFDLAVA